MADSRLHRLAGWTATLAVAALAGCGGSGGGMAAAPTPPSPPPPPPSGPTMAVRMAAAEATAANNAKCTSVGSYYWEVGDANGVLDSGRFEGSLLPPVMASTVMPIASASKWLYSTYYVQRVAGTLSDSDIQFFNFRSGYTNLAEPPGCERGDTVGSCLNNTNSKTGLTFGTRTDANIDHFFYNGGHMQVHAANHGLNGLNNAALAAELKSQLGSDVDITYTQPQLAGGVATTASEYGKVLRRILAGTLVMRDKLGTNPVCTNTDVQGACATALNTPSPPGERWHYAIGHWVEDDPTVGDGAFSSPGAFGFYPWIDKTKTYYGVVAQYDPAGAYESIYCGRLLRNAWTTGLEQTGANPTLR